MATAPKNIVSSKVDAIRLKKYFACAMKQNCDKDFKIFKEKMNAPFHHLFDDHDYCDSQWCHRRRELDAGIEVSSKVHGYYRSKDNEVDLSTFEDFKK